MKKTKASLSNGPVMPAKAKASPAAAEPKTSAVAAAPGTPAGRVRRSTKSPSEPAPLRVPVKFSAPAAEEVSLVGSFNDWDVGATPLRSSRDGEWRAEVKLAPGRYEYLFVVDGKWVPDPNAGQTTPNPFGGVNSVLVVP